MKLLVMLIAFGSLVLAETGEFRIYMIEHDIGSERYELARNGGGYILNTTIEFTDRANTRTTTTELHTLNDLTPVQLTIKGKPDSVTVENSSATVHENGTTRSFTLPNCYFTIFGSSPFAIQMMMLRYWTSHGKPAALPMLRANAKADPIEIKMAGQDSVTLGGIRTKLNRYTVANLAFGREVVWTKTDGDLVAAMTFAGGLPMEAIRTEYNSSFSALYRSGVAQEMADLKELAQQAAPDHAKTLAITGATLIDGNGGPAVKDSVVIVSKGRIAGAGARGAVMIPRGAKVVEASGQTLLPGLWEMHIHASGVEFGPAMLAAGITTARDCGGEFEYLVAQRDAMEKEAIPSPRMLLAGLVDAGGIRAFGNVTAETADEGRAVVNRYHAAGFQQIKLYTYLKPDVVRAISEEAHRLGMTVTGHVPQALNTFEGVEAGMDQINHLNYVTNMMRTGDNPRGPVDINSVAAHNAIEFLLKHHTVVDPTAGWGEMASHSKEVDVASFEPGILHAPFVLDAKFRGMGNTSSAEQMKTRMAQNLEVIGVLHKAGVPIVAGSDTGLPGYGLLRELELYVAAGFTPTEAIQSATIVAARAMGLDRDSGTIEAGKRADLILVNGDPLSNISDLRKVSQVFAEGRLYDTQQLWRSVGFHP